MTSKLAELEAELAEETAQLRAAEEREQMASRETTSWLNKANEAQKKLDACLAEIRATAPRATYWKQYERRGVAVSE